MARAFAAPVAKIRAPFPAPVIVFRDDRTGPDPFEGVDRTAAGAALDALMEPVRWRARVISGSAISPQIALLHIRTTAPT